MASEPKTIEQPALCFRAAVSPSTINDDNRTVEVTFSTGAPVKRFDWWTGKSYIEKLSMEPSAIRLDRLNAGAPVLNAHSAYSIEDQLGVVMDRSAKVEGKKGIATLRFSSRDSVEPIWRDVKDKIVRNVSVGYIIHKFEETTGKDGSIPVRTATDWEPYEISMVPMPADAAAQTRSGKRPEVTLYPCQVLTRDESVAPEGRSEGVEAMDRQDSEYITEKSPIQPPAPKAEPVEPTQAELAQKAERVRVQGIITAVRAAGLPSSLGDKLIADGVPLVDAQSAIFEELAKQDRTRAPQNVATRVEMGDGPLVHARKGIENALLHRMHPYSAAHGKTAEMGFKLTDEGREYRGMSLLDVARAYLHAANIRTSGMSKMDIAGLAMGLRAGYHTTSDFANLLADLPNKILRKAYLEAPQTFSSFTRTITLADFKKARLLQLGEAPALLAVGEHGEYLDGTMGESKEEVQLTTWGRKFSITRQALVNDDTDAFSRVPMAFGRQARNKESDLVWAEITNNANMGDGVALFHATHANLSGTSDAIAVASIGAGRTAMRRQTGIDGVSLMNIDPRTLIVSATKETIADQFVSTALLASQSSNVNPFAGKLTVVAEPRLDVNSTTAWYLAASPDQVDIIVLATLEGENGPRVDSRVGFDVDGVEIKISHDVAAKVVDFRGLWKNPGA